MLLICFSFKKISRLKLCNVLRAILQCIRTTNLRTWYWRYFSLLPWLILFSAVSNPRLSSKTKNCKFQIHPTSSWFIGMGCSQFLGILSTICVSLWKVCKKPRNSCDRSSVQRKNFFFCPRAWDKEKVWVPQVYSHQRPLDIAALGKTRWRAIWCANTFHALRKTFGT